MPEGSDVTRSAVEEFATPRLAAGALFVRGTSVLLVRKTYDNPWGRPGSSRWDIPGGYVNRGESPTAACEREVREELGLTRKVRRLLAHDWSPNDAEGDKTLYVFDCGDLGEDEDRVRLDRVEIDTVDWVDVDDLGTYVIPRLRRRLVHAFRARAAGRVAYLERGELPGAV